MKSWQYFIVVLSLFLGLDLLVAHKSVYSQSSTTGALEIAKQFLRDHASEYSLQPDLSDLKFLEVGSSLESDYVRFQQIYKGVTVYGVYLTVVISRDRQSAPRVSSSYDPSISLSNVTPKLSSETALSKALVEVDAKGELRGPTATELVVYPQGMSGKYKHYVLAWEAKIPTREPLGDWEVFIDATTGKVLDKYNRLVSLISVIQSPVNEPTQSGEITATTVSPLETPALKIGPLDIFNGIKAIFGRMLESLRYFFRTVI